MMGIRGQEIDEMADEMTHEEIEAHKNQLIRVGATIRDVQPDNQELLRELQDLAAKVGASPAKPAGADGRSWVWATAPDLVHNIHQALQTASMIHACRTAAKNHEIAVKAQESARLSLWVAVGAMLATVAMAVAGWIWH
jgi:hypothetical protein